MILVVKPVHSIDTSSDEITEIGTKPAVQAFRHPNTNQAYEQDTKISEMMWEIVIAAPLSVLASTVIWVLYWACRGLRDALE